MYIIYLSSTDDKLTNGPILTTIQKRKHTTINRAFTEGTPNKSNFIAQTTKEVKKADGLVVEVTQTTFDIGRLVTLALLQHKPVLLLQQYGHKHDIELGESRLVTKKTYKIGDTKKLDTLLSDFETVVEKQRLSYRFNLMLSRDINNFLMDRALGKGISKADYIRTLILSSMD